MRLWTGPLAAQAPAKDVLVIAEPYDLQNIDPSANTEDLNTVINENVFETLFAFDKNWQPAPVLAAALPEISDGGKLITHQAAPGRTVSRRHEHDGGRRGRFAAPLDRRLAARQARRRGDHRHQGDRAGRDRDQAFEAVRAADPADDLPQLAGRVLPKAKAEDFKDKPITRIEDLIGTGPFRYVERKPDQYIRLGKFDAYKSPEAPASMLPASATRW